MERTEIRLTGAGGQGLILGGIILAEASAIFDGKNAVQTQSYGPEARGGASKAEVIISNEEIDYPKVTSPDILLAMTQEAFKKYAGVIKPEAIVVLDSTYIDAQAQSAGKVYRIPITQIAKEEVGKSIVANIVAMGVIVELSGVVSKSSLEKAVLARVPKGTEELNKKALEAGFAAAAAARQG